jgi:hypothetical protein
MHVKFQVGMMAKSFSEVHFSIEPAGLVLVVFTVLTVFSEHKLFRMKCHEMPLASFGHVLERPTFLVCCAMVLRPHEGRL